MTPKTLPTSFLTLPDELRQDILIRTYHATSILAIQRWNHPVDNGRVWLVDFHKTKIEEWANTLQLIDEDIIDDVGFVKEWLKEVDNLPPSLPNGTLQWLDIIEDDRKAIWTFTQDGEERWKRIHRKLNILNRNWKHSKVNKDSDAYSSNSSNPPWDKQGAQPATDKNGFEIEKRWKQGPSKILWKDNSSGHHPSTWKRLQAAVDGDIAWIVQKEKKYRDEFARLAPVTNTANPATPPSNPQAPNAAAAGNPPVLPLSGILHWLADFRGLY